MDIMEQIRTAAADETALRNAVGDADIVPLLMSLVQLTGDADLLERAKPFTSGGWSYLQNIPADLQAEIRSRLVVAIQQKATGTDHIPADPPQHLFGQMMRVAVGQPVPDEYIPVFREEMSFGGVDHRDVHWRNQPTPEELNGFQVVIAGAGFSGLAMAVKLKALGIPYVVIEKNAEAGGTWLENFYPGCGVDTPCHFYSYSFATNTEWTEFFAKRDEILKYILRCVDDFGIRDKIRFSEEVTSADYDEASSTWIVKTRHADGAISTIRANAFVSAVGALNRPAIPNIPGLETFAGESFHTAEWNSEVDLAGKRVAMIGTGASGMQVGPSIAPITDQLVIFQRSPHWCIRHPLYYAKVSPAVRWSMKHIPFYASWFRFQLFWAASDGFHATLHRDPDWGDAEHSLNAANGKLREDLIAHIKAEIGDRTDLLDKVIPNYPPFGKRMLRDNGWYQMLKQPNVDLVTERPERIEPDAVVANGIRYPADVIVFATGFHAAKMLWPMEIRGRNGQSLRDIWGDDNPRAHLGITVPGFPNFFMLYGPNTNLAHGGSAIFHSECQVRYVMLALREMIERKASALEVRVQPFEDYNAKVDATISQMSWAHPGVSNWYKNKHGRVVMNSPWRLVDYRNMTAELEPSEYEFSTSADDEAQARVAAQ